jgi:uncharacterized membrane protein
VVGVAATEDGYEAYRWTEADGLVGLGHLYEQRDSWARAVSADGATVVGRAGTMHNGRFMMAAYRWTAEEGMLELGGFPTGTDYSDALGVSADGSVIVGTFNDREGVWAFVWDAANGVRVLEDILTDAGVDLGGWKLGYALDVSDDGLTIAGTGLNADDRTEAYIAHIPEPSSAALLLFGLCLAPEVARRARRKS